MEETMSSYSFSHQFYQHWTQAPEPVRSAIVQELTDITDLLQTETPFEKFVFSTHDLDAHLDDLYCAHEAKQAAIKEQEKQAAAKEIADKQVKQREEAERQRLEEKLLQEKEEKRLKEEEKQRLDAKKKAADQAQKEAEAQKLQEAEQQQKADAEQARKEESKTTDNSNTDNVDKDNKSSRVDDKDSQHDTNDATNNGANDNQADTVITSDKTLIAKPNKGAAINLSPTNSKLSAGHEALIHELEMHIDDYLTEQMLQISEDLKSWLRSEVSRQLIEQEQINETVTKKNG